MQDGVPVTCLYFCSWASTSSATLGNWLRPFSSQKKSPSPTYSMQLNQSDTLCSLTENKKLIWCYLSMVTAEGLQPGSQYGHHSNNFISLLLYVGYRFRVQGVGLGLIFGSQTVLRDAATGKRPASKVCLEAALACMRCWPGEGSASTVTLLRLIPSTSCTSGLYVHACCSTCGEHGNMCSHFRITSSCGETHSSAPNSFKIHRQQFLHGGLGGPSVLQHMQREMHHALTFKSHCHVYTHTWTFQPPRQDMLELDFRIWRRPSTLHKVQECLHMK